jgi:GT2 family glycosyltransferase
VTFNVFLERELDLRRYLNRLHNLAGDRPLVLGEVGLHAGDGPEGAQQQADVLDWQLGTAIERGVAGTCVFSWTDDWVVGGQRVEDWRFGLTTADREPRPALEVVERWNRRTVADLDQTWPAISVVICAYNAEATLEECLLHTCALDFPNLEIIVVDDGSTDRTAEIARGHPRARLVSIPHGGLSVARNEGWKAATGELIAYLDSDAYPTPEWLHYLSLGLYSSAVAAVGGPNVPPVDDPPGAQVVARSPGGPVHVLIGDDRAEHVPGCNMAFWRYALQEIGGFDPIYTSAGDDVDVCWKVLDQGYEIGFHPAALVWHHRRPGLRTYLRQQRGYGRAEALVESRHPDRFTPLGTARWSGRIYNSLVPGGMRQRVYRGVFGAAPFQSIYGGGGHMIDLAHQAGVPVAAALAATLPLGLLEGALAFPGVLALLFILGLFVLDVVRTRAPRGWAGSHLRFRADVAAHHLLQPLVRLGGRCWRPNVQRGEIPPHEDLPGPARRVARHTWLLPADRPRPELTGSLVGRLRRAGLRLTVTTGWEDYDAKILGSALVHADLVTSGYPEGCMQVRLRWRPRWARVCIGAAAIAWTAVVSPATGVLLALLGLVEIGRGVHRPAAAIRRVLLLHTDRAENGVAA